MTSPLEAIIRFPDPVRLETLSRTVFSLALADHRPTTIIVACQRFPPRQLQAVRDALAPLLTIASDVGLQILNRPHPTSANRRAALMNLGLSASRARYLAFFGDTDIVYPEAHRLLIAELVASDAAIAFGGLLEAQVSHEGLVPITTAKHPVFSNEDPASLPRDAARQLPGAVLDRHRIVPEHLLFDEASPQPEHDFILRLCANAPASIRLRQTILGESARDHSGKKSGTDR